ncbi:MAG: cytochrome c [bacterium]
MAEIGDAARGDALLQDRAVARSGLACADCHALGAALRPGPPVGALARQATWWWGTAPDLAAAVQRCVERYQTRPPLDGRALGDVIAALQAAPAPTPAAVPDAPAALYAAACRPCHEDGPGPPVLGRTWPSSFLRARIRGTDRPAHPDTLMPAFAPDRLPDAALDGLVDALGRDLLRGPGDAPASGLWRSPAPPATVPDGEDAWASTPAVEGGRR